MNLVLIGPPGSGKGTQAELLVKHFKIASISLGQLYRDEIRRKTKWGKQAASYVLRGELVPAQITDALLRSELKKQKYKNGLVFDGFPRNFEQAEFFEKIAGIDYVIFIKITQKEILKRLGGRYICDCGQTYNIFSEKSERPKHDLTCDKCGRKLKQRADDLPKSISKRLKIYYQETKPLLEYYQKQGKLIKINGSQKIDQVFSSIVKALKAKAIKT